MLGAPPLLFKLEPKYLKYELNNEKDILTFFRQMIAIDNIEAKVSIYQTNPELIVNVIPTFT